MNKRPTILITNDDGVTAPGLKLLAETMQGFGEVIVVAPDSPQSGMGHAITIGNPLRLDKVDFHAGIPAWQCSGTPVDCVKLAVNKILKRKPNLCVSGINHGSNSSINVIYSGTMSAAMEGAIEGIPSIGFSHGNYDHEFDMKETVPYIKKITESVLKNGLPSNQLLNVNFPAKGPFSGIKVCRQAVAKWQEEFDERTDPNKRKYYWLTGEFELMDNEEDTDEFALRDGFVSVVPVQFDFTDYSALETLKNWQLDV